MSAEKMIPVTGELKGRNGYTKLTAVEIWVNPADNGRVWLNGYSSRSEGTAGARFILLPAEARKVAEAILDLTKD